jgi:hypothetical protein
MTVWSHGIIRSGHSRSAQRPTAPSLKLDTRSQPSLTAVIDTMGGLRTFAAGARSQGRSSESCHSLRGRNQECCNRSKGSFGVGFSDATRAVWVTRIVAWRRRSAQAGNRGVGLGGSVMSMGICGVRVLWIRLDRLVARGIFGKKPHEFF